MPLWWRIVVAVIMGVEIYLKSREKHGQQAEDPGP
jgi:hypothetical protein